MEAATKQYVDAAAAADPAAAQGVLGYAERTTSQTGITSIADITSLTVTLTYAANRWIRITAKATGLLSSVATDRGVMRIREGSTTLNHGYHAFRTAGTTEDGITVEHILTPSTGSHTYKVSYERFAGTGTHEFVCAVSGPSFILIEDLGAV